jgi:Skp family chaperone for outer membrane proteins
MDEEIVHVLRATTQRLSQELQSWKAAFQRLETELRRKQEQLQGERQLSKSMRMEVVNQMKLCRERDAKKHERAMRELRAR